MDSIFFLTQRIRLMFVNFESFKKAEILKSLKGIFCFWLISTQHIVISEIRLSLIFSHNCVE